MSKSNFNRITSDWFYRAITRAPHGTRLYCVVPDRFLDVMHTSDPDSGGSVIQTIYNGLNHLTNRNKRASNILGFPVYGDAILANVGSSWKLEGKLSFGDVSLPCYHRSVLAIQIFDLYAIDVYIWDKFVSKKHLSFLFFMPSCNFCMICAQAILGEEP